VEIRLLLSKIQLSLRDQDAIYCMEYTVSDLPLSPPGAARSYDLAPGEHLPHQTARPM
jgi:hypothetical protein